MKTVSLLNTLTLHARMSMKYETSSRMYPDENCLKIGFRTIGGSDDPWMASKSRYEYLRELD